MKKKPEPKPCETAGCEERILLFLRDGRRSNARFCPACRHANVKACRRAGEARLKESLAIARASGSRKATPSRSFSPLERKAGTFAEFGAGSKGETLKELKAAFKKAAVPRVPRSRRGRIWGPSPGEMMGG